MSAAIVEIITSTEADFVAAFRYLVNGVGFDFTGYRLLMMVRKQPADVDAYVSLTSDPDGGITVEPFVGGGDPNDGTFSILILRTVLQQMPAGAYVHSLLLEEIASGLRDEIWTGPLTHSIGTTR
jgi:hypothetical protein